MLYMIIGGSKAGKSRYAEKLAVGKNGGRLLYIATMIPVGDGEAGTACVNRHRAQREGLGFETLEQPCRLQEISYLPEDVVLLEDLPNLIGNYLFKEGSDNAYQAALSDVLSVAESCGTLIVVSYSEMAKEPEFDTETCSYIDSINKLTQELCGRADGVVMLEQGRPTILKGDAELLDF